MFFGYTITLPMFWMILFAVFAAAEALTVGLVSVWFCAGALCAFAAAKANAPVYVQIIVFLVVSIALFIFTRPFAKHVLKIKTVPTNLDRIIGESVYVTEKIDNRADTGTIKYDGKLWTARSSEADIVFDEGSFAKVERIEGVKVIVKKE